MDAKELTIKYNKMYDQMNEFQRKVSYLEQVCEKLEMKVKDMEIDVKMLQRVTRR